MELPLTEEEYDKHIDREIGYDMEGDWSCKTCREEEEPWCYENSTKDTIESDRCYCSVGNCVLPTFIEE